MGSGRPGSSNRFSGKTAVVTGAMGGIGQRVVEGLISEGAEVLAVDLPGAAQDRWVEEDAVTLLSGDLERSDFREALLTTAQKAGGADFLVNAHGLVRINPLEAVSERDWDALMGANAKSVFFLNQVFGFAMRPGSSIVNFGSMAAKAANVPVNAPYSAAKAAVIAITKTFAQALAPHVRVNAVCPGIIDTNMQRAAIRGMAVLSSSSEAEITEQRARSIPLQRPGRPDEVASLVLFLLSDESSYMTGQAINVTGGLITY